MIRLLSAGFPRLKKEKIFWIGVGFMAIAAFFIVRSEHQMMLHYETEPSIENVVTGYCQFAGIFAAAFSSLFLGTEYSDGTIRNKLIIGHKRSAVYCSSLILNITAALLMCAAYLLVALGLGIPLLKLSFEEPLRIAFTLFGSALMTVACCAIFTFISLLCRNKAASTALNLLTAFFLLIAASYIVMSLEQPEFWEAYSFSDESGELVEMPAEPNPSYPRGLKRDILEFLNDFLPGNQAFRYLALPGPEDWIMPVYACVTAAAFTGGGILLFKRKDLK